MKKLLTVSLLALFATSAHAQGTINGPAIIPGGNIIYNLNPMPPIVSNNRIQYPPGTAYVGPDRKTRICNGPLSVDGSGKARSVTCKPLGEPVTVSGGVDASGLSNLAPAAGGPRSLSKDGTLSSDANAGLRSDRLNY